MRKLITKLKIHYTYQSTHLANSFNLALVNFMIRRLAIEEQEAPAFGQAHKQISYALCKAYDTRQTILAEMEEMKKWKEFCLEAVEL